LIREVTSRGSDHEELMSSASTALLCVDTEGCVTGWNAAMERLSGASRLAVVGCGLLGEVLGPAGILEWLPQENAEAMTELSVQLLAVLGIEKLPSPSSPTAAQLDLGIVRETVVGSSSSLSSGVRMAVGDGSFHSSSFECQSAAVNVRFVRAPGRRSTKEGHKLTQVDVAITCRRLLSGDGAVTGALFFVQVRGSLEQI
jgi:PAS domain-containing protein